MLDFIIIAGILVVGLLAALVHDVIIPKVQDSKKENVYKNHPDLAEARERAREAQKESKKATQIKKSIVAQIDTLNKEKFYMPRGMMVTAETRLEELRKEYQEACKEKRKWQKDFEKWHKLENELYEKYTEG